MMMIIITTIPLLLLVVFICGWRLSYNFKRYSDESNLQGVKNYLRMRKGLKILFKKLTEHNKELPKNELEDKKEIIKKELEKPIDNFLSLDTSFLNVLIKVENKHLYTILFAYYQRKLSNEITLKKDSFLTTFDGKTILYETRDVNKIIIPTEKDIASDFERELLAVYMLENKGSYMLDYVYQYFLHLRMEDNITPADTVSIPGSFIRFRGEKDIIQNVTNIIQRKKHFANINETYKKITK